MAKAIQVPKYLQTLIAQGEHQQLDFKYAINDSRKIAITLCAFANSDGGTLLIGVKDNGSIAGAKLEEEIYMVQAAADIYCRPPVSFKTQGWKAGDKYVLEVTVEKTSRKPCMAQAEDGKWWAYLRSGDENFPVPSVLLQYWKDYDRPQPEQYLHTEKEQKLLSLLQDEEGFTLNQLAKQTTIPRQGVSGLLSKWMRWELVEMTFDRGVAKFKSKEDRTLSSNKKINS